MFRLADSALCFQDEIHWRPEYLAQSAWLEHIPFAFWIVRALKPCSLVELGTHWGVSYGAFCQAVDQLALDVRCYAVDTWLGDDHSGIYGNEVFSAVNSLNETRWKRFSTLLRMTFAEARQYFAAGEVDLLHIDGLHTYEAAAADFNCWRETLSDRGVVLFHDTNVRERNFGIWRLWKELTNDYPHFEFIHGHGLGVLGIGEKLPEPLRALFAASENPVAKAEIRALFAACGEAVKFRWIAQEAGVKRHAADVQSSQEKAEMESRYINLQKKTESDVEVLRAQAAAAQRLMQEKAEMESRYNAILHSKSWRITRPLREINRLIRRNTRMPEKIGNVPEIKTADLSSVQVQDEDSVGQLIAREFPSIQPYSCYLAPISRPRLSVITDSVGPSSLFGGVGTALMLGAELANRLGATLRIITRTEQADASQFSHVITNAGLNLDNALELAMVPLNSVEDLSVAPDELFLTTSWWTTQATLGVVNPRRIIELVQEDERLFYAQGDERLRCSETLNQPDIIKVVNTEILYRHFTVGSTALVNIIRNGVYFEPAFLGKQSNKTLENTKNGIRRMFFYARPHNLRNLFWRGIEALDEAAAEGIISADKWELYWVGVGLPKVRLGGGIKPICLPPMSWGDYQSFISTMDAGFVLMDTPHPSYPPLDLAAAGAAVLTTIYPGKESLACYSDNIIMAEPSREALVHGLRQLVDLANDDDARARNRAADRIARNWSDTLAPVVTQIISRISA